MRTITIENCLNLRDSNETNSSNINDTSGPFDFKMK